MAARTKLPIEVALVDKSPLVHAALKSLLAHDERFSLAFVASDGERFLDALERLHCDVAVMGWVMPYKDGRAVLEALAGRPERPRIVIYTGDPDPALPRQAMALGAAAFLSKREPPERLLDILTAVAHGQMVFPFLDVRSLHADPLGRLSPRERELLGSLGTGCTNAELARALGVSVNTVKFHLRNLFDKLGVRNRAQAVQLWHEARR
ncbi:response regulator transcription factor [Benzoatithermus flavus]|uniref:Response regulator transcription factor n=1 Tax=Benzoatithermus flavus TaxID=3108223 RepID=A0ABU8XPR0_9PROT